MTSLRRVMSDPFAFASELAMLWPRMPLLIRLLRSSVALLLDEKAVQKPCLDNRIVLELVYG